MGPWILVATWLAAGSASHSLPAPPVNIVFSAGRVSVDAVDAPIAGLLVAWGRNGGSQISGIEYLGSRTITLHLSYTREADALQAIVGSPSWYTLVVREAPAASMSTLERIVILPAAAAAAPASPEPETRYIYSENPAAAAIASVLLARRTERGAGEPPMQGEPEAFYHYDPIPDRPDELNVLPPPGAVTRSPMLPTSTAEPETVYSYTVPPAVAEGLAPLVFSPGAAPTGDPESRFTYDVPLSDNDFGRWASQRTGPVWVPALPLSLGWTEPRLPGRQIRYVVDR